jgi:hypothetical protein
LVSRRPLVVVSLSPRALFLITLSRSSLCRKTYKSDKALANHVQSNDHRKLVQQLVRRGEPVPPELVPEELVRKAGAGNAAEAKAGGKRKENERVQDEEESDDDDESDEEEEEEDEDEDEEDEEDEDEDEDDEEDEEEDEDEDEDEDEEEPPGSKN